MRLLVLTCCLAFKAFGAPPANAAATTLVRRTNDFLPSGRPAYYYDRDEIEITTEFLYGPPLSMAALRVAVNQLQKDMKLQEPNARPGQAWVRPYLALSYLGLRITIETKFMVPFPSRASIQYALVNIHTLIDNAAVDHHPFKLWVNRRIRPHTYTYSAWVTVEKLADDSNVQDPALLTTPIYLNGLKASDYVDTEGGKGVWVPVKKS